MPAPTGQDASAKDSDVHVIDIDADVDQVVDPIDIDKSDIPVIHIDKPTQVNTMNGSGKCLFYFSVPTHVFFYSFGQIFTAISENIKIGANPGLFSAIYVNYKHTQGSCKT